jgi:hypothetical protein
MTRYEHRVFRVKVSWDGGDYYLAAIIEKSDDWLNVDVLGERGWEFVAFVPNHEVYINTSFDEEHLQYIRLAVFKRAMEEHEDMDWDKSRARVLDEVSYQSGREESKD